MALVTDKVLLQTLQAQKKINKKNRKQADWNQNDENAVDFIKNKPTQKQADWNQNDSTAPDYIKNRICYDKLAEIKVPAIELHTLQINDTNVYANRFKQSIQDAFSYSGPDKPISYIIINNIKYKNIQVRPASDSRVREFLSEDGNLTGLGDLHGNYDIRLKNQEFQIGQTYIMISSNIFDPVKIPSKFLSSKGTSGEGEYSENFNNSTGASGFASHAEGSARTASGDYSHAEGKDTIASGYASHAEGCQSEALGNQSHAEGYGISAFGSSSHAEGESKLPVNIKKYYSPADFNVEVGLRSLSLYFNGLIKNKLQFNSTAIASGLCPIPGGESEPFNYCLLTQDIIEHPSQNKTEVIFIPLAQALNKTECTRINTITFLDKYTEKESGFSGGTASHSEGYKCKTYSINSHAEGYRAKTLGPICHAEGNNTIAAGINQHVQGRWNTLDRYNYAHIVGNGTSDTNRSNAHTLDWDGTAWFANTVKIGGTGQDDVNAKELSTKEYVDTEISKISLTPSPLVKTLTTTAIQLENNVIYRAESLASINFTLPDSTLNSVFEAELDLTVGATPIQVIAPSGIDWMGDDIESGAWVPTENKRYSLYIYWDGVRYRAISQSQKIGG